MQKRRDGFRLFLCAALWLCFAERGGALIPEPDAIYYGNAYVDGVQLTAADSNFTILVRVDGEIVSSYAMGAMPAAEDWYVLQVPLDALDPRTPGTARSGDSATISITDADTETVLAMIDIGARGSITPLDLSMDSSGIDTDEDGIPDSQDAFPLDPDETMDTDGDGIGNNADPDDDDDGISDEDELALGRNPLVHEGRVLPPFLMLLLED